MSVRRRVLWVYRAAAVATLLAVAMGSVVCATDSGFECGTWPGCTDQALLPQGPVSTLLSRNPWIEMVHRTSAILAGPLAVTAGILGARARDAHPWARWLPWVTVLGAVIAGIVGRAIVLGLDLPVWAGAVDLGSALAALAAIWVATLALQPDPSGGGPRAAGRLAWTAVALVAAMHLVSLYAAGPGSYTRCLSWPVWAGVAADGSTGPGLHRLRLLLAAAGGAASIAAAILSRRAAPRTSAAVLTLLGAVVLLGLALGVTGADLGVPMSLASVALWWVLVLLAARSGRRGRLGR